MRYKLLDQLEQYFEKYATNLWYESLNYKETS